MKKVVSTGSQLSAADAHSHAGAADAVAVPGSAATAIDHTIDISSSPPPSSPPPPPGYSDANASSSTRDDESVWWRRPFLREQAPALHQVLTRFDAEGILVTRAVAATAERVLREQDGHLGRTMKRVKKLIAAGQLDHTSLQLDSIPVVSAHATSTADDAAPVLVAVVVKGNSRASVSGSM